MKLYYHSCVYRGQQIEKKFCAKNNKEAAEILGVSTYFISKYCSVVKTDETFEGVMAKFDSGMLWEKEKSLINVYMPLERLQAIIDSYKDKSYQIFKKQMGIE